ncbi:hypothetical protein NFI96_024946 [Prochilodus magdalenae]|nr:hypothetical protein NFI96_024946 [Prochilodus magdalenae]
MMDGGPFLRTLTKHREVLVEQVKNTQCVLDNLKTNGFICNEDIEIIQRAATKTDQENMCMTICVSEQVRKILELVQSKGEEASAYFIHILHEAYDAYIDLRPWFDTIQYTPAASVRDLPVINTDPISKYSEKLRNELGRDTRFLTSYSQREETLLDELYMDTQMELFNDKGESLGYLENLDDVLGEQGVFNQQAETIFITGDAGVGKSILLQKLQNLWSKRQLNTRAKFFFKFRCRMFSAFKETDEISVRDLIFKYNCYPDGDPDNEVFGYILRFPETVLFTFDGYDEIQMDFDMDNVPEVVSPEERTHPLLVLMNLLCGKLLKGSRKVLTARTGTEIQSRVVRKKVVLKGFSPDHLRRYMALHFPQQEHKEVVSVRLDANPHLCGLCSIPLFSWIIFKSFKHLQSMYDNYELPDSSITLTNVFLLLSEVFLARVTKRPGLLKRSTQSTAETFRAGLKTLTAFSRLALRGLEKSGFIYSQEDLTSCGLGEEDLQVGFLRPVGHYDACGGAATFEFLHLTLQAFLTAFSLVLDSDMGPDGILKFFAKCAHRKSSRVSCICCLGRSSHARDTDPFQTNEHFQFTNLFLCGLLSKTNSALLEHLVPPLSLRKKRASLKSYLSTSVKTHLRGLPRSPSTDIKGNKVHAMPNFLWMLRCIFETNSDDVARLTAKGISAEYIKLAYCNIYSADCSALNFVLHHHKKSLGVDLDNNNINDYGVQQLIPSFSKMTVVRLSWRDSEWQRVIFSDESRFSLGGDAQRIRVWRHRGQHQDGRSVVTRPEDLVSLHLHPYRTICRNCVRMFKLHGMDYHRTPSGTSTAPYRDVWRVGLANTAARRHTERQTSVLCESAHRQQHGGSVQRTHQAQDHQGSGASRHELDRLWLRLYKNHITDAGAEMVAQIIGECPHLKTVKLGCNRITSVGAKRLAQAIQKSKSIYDVGMWGNSIGDEGAEAFAEALRNHPSLTNLSLSANGISSQGGRSLARALKENSSLHIFWLIQNQISDEAAPELGEALRSNSALTHIMLIDNQLTARGAQQLREGLASNTAIKEVNIKGNQVSEEEEKEFASEKRLRFR